MFRIFAGFAAGFVCAKFVTGSESFEKVKAVASENASKVKNASVNAARVVKEEFHTSSEIIPPENETAAPAENG